jgi:hypothetical protein
MGKYAIYIVSALIFSMLTYSNGLRNALFISNSRTVESYSINQAQNIAQSAMMVTLNDIINDDDSPFNVDSDETYAYPGTNEFQPWQEMHGHYNITVTNQADSLLTIRATGRFEESTYVAAAGLTKSVSSGWMPNIDQAVHAENSILLRGSSSVQGDASINSINYGAVDITGGPNAIIGGNLFIGPGGVPDEVVPDQRSHWGGGGPGPVQGDIFVMEQELEYEMPEFPPWPNYNVTGNSFRNSRWNDPTFMSIGDYQGKYLPEVEVGSNRSLTIEVGDEDRTLFVGDLDIKQGHVNISGSGKLSIYVVNDMTLNGSSSVNSGGDVNQVFMYYGGQSELAFRGSTQFNGGIYADRANVVLGGSNSLKGNLITGGSEVTIHGAASATSRVVYAPNAEVVLKGSGTIYGSVISDSFEAKGNSHVIYREDLDSELPDLGGGGGEETFTVLYWN